MSLYSIRTIKLASARRLVLFISSLLCGLCLSSNCCQFVLSDVYVRVIITFVITNELITVAYWYQDL